MRTPEVDRRDILRGAATMPIALTFHKPGLPAPSPGTGIAQRTLDDLVARDGLPGAQAVITRPSGRSSEITSGFGDLRSRRPFPRLARIRIASNTKAFTATAVLHLVSQGRVVLDRPISRYLPEIDSDATVRQVLRHQSGFHDIANDVTEHSRGRYRAADLVAMALRRPPGFEPGTRWEYCNTNYLVAGLLIERITRRPAQEEITRRVIRPLGLRHTYWPRYPEQTLRGPHARAYMPPGHTEVRWINTSVLGTAGALVSTGQDLNRFFAALLAGRLLPPDVLAEMCRTVPADVAEGAACGLGLFRFPLPDGGAFWGHGGSVEGTRTRGGATPEGLAVNVAVNEITTDPGGSQHLVDAAATILRSH